VFRRKRTNENEEISEYEIVVFIGVACFKQNKGYPHIKFIRLGSVLAADYPKSLLATLSLGYTDFAKAYEYTVRFISILSAYILIVFSLSMAYSMTSTIGNILQMMMGSDRLKLFEYFRDCTTCI